MEYLEEALEGLARQTYSTLEILILDNGSPPAAEAVFHRFAAERENVRILRSEQRLPMFSNFNRGIQNASGEIVAFFHDDDVYQPGFLKRAVELLEMYPSAGFVGGNFDLIDRAGNLTRSSQYIDQTQLWSGRRFIQDLIRRGRCGLSTPGLVFRKSALGTTGFDEKLPINWGDFAILMRIAESWDVAVDAEVHYAWRVHGQNESAIPFADSIPLRTRVFRDYLESLRSRDPSAEELTQELEKVVRRGQTIGFVWGWFSGVDDEDAESCRILLARQGSPATAALLLFLQKVGFSLKRRKRVMPAIRRISGILER
jgi:glycosyltransferase involved in cell wall biosynthesis